MSYSKRPLYLVTTMNDNILREDTDPSLKFEYVDISRVNNFEVSSELTEYSFSDSPSRARRKALPGDVIISTVGNKEGKICLIDDNNSHYVYSTGFSVVRPLSEFINSRFLGYSVISKEFMEEVDSISNGVIYSSVNSSDLARIRIPLPPLETQQRIADYLDEETSRIDNTVSTLEELIEEMKSRRVQLIQESISSPDSYVGLREFAEINPSSHEGMRREGDAAMPNTLYRRAPLGVLARLRSGENTSGDSFSKDDSLPTPVYGANGVIGSTSLEPNIQRESILIGRVGSCGEINVAPPSSFASDNVLVVDLNEKAHRGWMYYVLLSSKLKDLNTSTAQPLITASKIRQVRVPFPSIMDQKRIADYLDVETAKIDKIISTATELRSELLSRRSALITEVVTGQRKV